jgi:hypothetical protein
MPISLDEMSALARALVDADEATKEAELALKHAKEAARILREETIPSAMQELGVEELKLSTGQKITIAQEVYASIPAPMKDEAMNWLEDNGFAGLIKVAVATQYGKGEIESAKELFHELQERGISCKFDESVHPMTLKAFLKEQISNGNNVPMELFGARPVWTAKIK